MFLFLPVASLFMAGGFAVASIHRRVGNAVPTSIDLGYAKYQGAEWDGVKQWLGVAYAAPPLDDLRWRAPQDPANTIAVQDATSFKAVCIGTQVTFIGNRKLGEDCLYLNIYVPANATAVSKLPVWFYIQGGGYSRNSNENYNGTAVIRRSGGNIIWVGINYRVGAFGFLASEKIRKNGALNAGILDQRKALQWVQRYIAQFGGDPNHVVIHGSSAGGGSVALHMAWNGGKDEKLFAAGIGESIYFPTQRKVSEMEYQFKNFVDVAGCSTENDTMTCLRAKDPSSLMIASSSAGPYPNNTDIPFFPYAPCIDGEMIADYPLNLFKTGKFVKVPMMLGDDTNEGTYFVANASTPAEVSSWIHTQFPNLSPENLTRINELYPLKPAMPLRAAYFPSLEAAWGEATFTCPSFIIAHEISKYVGRDKIWNYRYNVQDTDMLAAGLGVPHTSEIAAVMGQGGGSYETYNKPAVNEVMDYWANFVRYLDPNGKGGVGNGVKWDNWMISEDQRRLIIQTNATMVEMVGLNETSRCEFWNEVVDLTES